MLPKSSHDRTFIFNNLLGRSNFDMIGEIMERNLGCLESFIDSVICHGYGAIQVFSREEVEKIDSDLDKALLESAGIKSYHLTGRRGTAT
jgi:hypothetical protein